MESFTNRPNAKLEKWFDLYRKLENNEQAPAEPTTPPSATLTVQIDDTQPLRKSFDKDNATPLPDVIKSGEILISFRYEINDAALQLLENQRKEILQMRPGQFGYKVQMQ